MQPSGLSDVDSAPQASDTSVPNGLALLWLMEIWPDCDGSSALTVDELSKLYELESTEILCDRIKHSLDYFFAAGLGQEFFDTQDNGDSFSWTNPSRKLEELLRQRHMNWNFGPDKLYISGPSCHRAIPLSVIDRLAPPRLTQQSTQLQTLHDEQEKSHTTPGKESTPRISAADETKSVQSESMNSNLPAVDNQPPTSNIEHSKGESQQGATKSDPIVVADSDEKCHKKKSESNQSRVSGRKRKRLFTGESSESEEGPAAKR